MKVQLNGFQSSYIPENTAFRDGKMCQVELHKAGPLLFTIYINDLIESCQGHSDIYIFADDAKFARHINQSQDCCELQEVIDLLNKWSSQWLLKLNVKNCHIDSFGRNVDKYMIGNDIKQC